MALFRLFSSSIRWSILSTLLFFSGWLICLETLVFPVSIFCISPLYDKMYNTKKASGNFACPLRRDGLSTKPEARSGAAYSPIFSEGGRIAISGVTGGLGAIRTFPFSVGHPHGRAKSPTTPRADGATPVFVNLWSGQCATEGASGARPTGKIWGRRGGLWRPHGVENSGASWGTTERSQDPARKSERAFIRCPLGNVMLHGKFWKLNRSGQLEETGEGAGGVERWR